MGRLRKSHTHLPPYVHPGHGAYWYVEAGGWKRLGTTLSEAHEAYALNIEPPEGSMPELIDYALEQQLMPANPAVGVKRPVAATEAKTEGKNPTGPPGPQQRAATPVLPSRQGKPIVADPILRCPLDSGEKAS